MLRPKARHVINIKIARWANTVRIIHMRSIRFEGVKINVRLWPPSQSDRDNTLPADICWRYQSCSHTYNVIRILDLLLLLGAR